MIKGRRIYKLSIFSVIVVTALFLFPLFVNSFPGVSFLDLLQNRSNGFSDSLFRTLSFALLSAVINVIVGFGLSLLFQKISLFTRLGKLLGFFLLPIVLGNVAVVFLFKVAFFNTPLFNYIVVNGQSTQTIFLLFLQFWQLGFLFAYLFWINSQSIPARVNDYSNAIRLSGYERLRDIILPYNRNLFILLLVIGFVFSFYEDTKSQFLFKASQGLSTELITHWQYRTYQSALLLNPTYATQITYKAGLVVFLASLFVFSFMGLVALIGFRIISRLNIKRSNIYIWQSKIAKKNIIPPLLVLICLAVIFLPIVVTFIRSDISPSKGFYFLQLPFFLTLMASLISTIFAIFFAISSRLLFRKFLSTFNSKALAYFVLIFIIQLIPPLCIVLSGFKGLSLIGYTSELVIYLVWIIGHCFLTLPILGSFLTATHFRVPENELQFLTAYQIPQRAVLNFSFFKRFKAEYLLTLLFAFSFIWNDTGLNMILSDQIPSFAANLQMLFIGRAADYSQATAFLIVALILSLSSVFIWQYIIDRWTKTLKQK